MLIVRQPTNKGKWLKVKREGAKGRGNE